MSSPAAERNGRKDEGKEGTPMVAEQAEVVPAQKRKRSVSRSPAPPSPHRRRLSPPRGPRYDLPPRGPRNDARHDRPAVPDVDLARARERERQLAEQMEKRTEEPEKKPFDAKAEFERLMETRAGGTYVPPARLRALQAQFTDKNTKEYQRMHWEALKKSINGLINKVNTSNIKMIIPELFGENLVRGRGLYARSIMKAQAASLPFTPVLTALTAVVNTKLPQVGELLLTRLIVQFRKAFKRNDKSVCLSSTTFIAHLCNQAVAHEIVALQILSLLLERPTDDSVEVAVGFIREVGAYLAEVSPKANNGVFDRFRAILHEGQIDKRVQYMIEVLFQVRKDKYKDHPIIPEGLDLVEEDDQITHYISLDDELDVQEGLGVFKFDPEFEENEERYKEIKAEILGDSGEESGSDDEDESDEEETEGAAVVDEAKRQEIQDQTNTNLVNLRRTIYLTIMSSVDYEECCHKLMRINIPEGQQIELANMIVECCSQERTYSRFYGLMGERFCKLNRMWTDTFQSAFQTYYETIHRYESNKLRNIAKFFGHLLSTEAIHWHVLSCIHLNEDETTSSSRIFIKILFQDLQESLGLNALKAVMADPMLEECFGGLFPRDESRNTRFAINYFTSIGLGAVTEGLREWLKGNPTVPAALPAKAGSRSSSIDSRSSYDSRGRSRSRSYSSRSRSGSYSDSRSRSRSRSYSSSRSRSRSSDSRDSRRSRSYCSSRSPSPRRGRTHGRARSRSRSRSRSYDSRSRSRSRSSSYSRSRSRLSRSRSRTGSYSDSRSRSRSRSRSHSKSPPRSSRPKSRSRTSPKITKAESTATKDTKESRGRRDGSRSRTPSRSRSPPRRVRSPTPKGRWRGLDGDFYRPSRKSPGVDDRRRDDRRGNRYDDRR
ncbi:hypothetical protein G7K_2430-t1 [Saitoella complicata NRRL Y-17804]|uniref:MI domain-containing protein n=1 Tax=Saitoella complicata (strain BCRC 22490 / CBS 7301 / JCM 7358 / NBRC 10748 / NRRL Y-17804) TaxID=698492 RepID=A0A0E9NFR2_SAICN|nr:hypothetical protein G7K_2430-t1 [Saitoella complicata NRRL Y-17804]